MTTDATTRQPDSWTADASTFGARLALIRQKMGWGNVKTAAEQCGLPVESWRNWERDGIEPRRLTTIAMTIAGRVGCDYLWLVHGPGRGERLPTDEYPDPREGRVVARIGDSTNGVEQPPAGWTHPTRAVKQTRPLRNPGSRLRIPVPV